MTRLTFIEKQVLEELFGMASGYVLDFSDRTYESFFKDFGINIEAKKYHIHGRSKANRMRAFWEIEDDLTIGTVLNGLCDYIETFHPDDTTVEPRHIKITAGLLRKNEGTALQMEDGFLKRSFDAMDITGLQLETSLEHSISQRLNEIKVCLDNKAYLAATILCGSTLEGILLSSAKQHPHQFNTAVSAPKNQGKIKQLQDWTLNDLINTAREVDLIGEDVKIFSHALRDFRNYIHPHQQSISNFNPDQHTALISQQVLQAAIADLTGDR